MASWGAFWASSLLPAEIAASIFFTRVFRALLTAVFRRLRFSACRALFIADRFFLSGTGLRKALSEGGDIPVEFSRPEVLAILREYYSGLTEKVEIKTHKFATGDTGKK